MSFDSTPDASLGLDTQLFKFRTAWIRAMVNNITGVDPGSFPVINLNDVLNKYGIQPVAMATVAQYPLHVTQVGNGSGTPIQIPAAGYSLAQTFKNVNGVYTSAGTPASIQIYTVTATKTFYGVIQILSGTVAHTAGQLRDATVDGGTVIAAFRSGTGAGVSMPNTGLLRLTNGIRFDAADQTTLGSVIINVWGWEE